MAHLIRKKISTTQKGKPIRKIPFQKCVDALLKELKVKGCKL